jgi:hypothetical protein
MKTNQMRVRFALSALSAVAALTLSVAGLAQAQEGGDVEYKRVSISGQFDNGQIVHGKMSGNEAAQAGTDMSGAFIQRTGVWITQEAVVKERLRLTMGVGGMFWYVLPVTKTSAQRQTQFGPGISQAQGIYTFGDLDNPTATLQMGYFPYKYNSDAKNLGEYLMRSGTYPGYIVTGGWNMMNSAGYMVQGLRVNTSAWDGKIQTDFLLAMEHDLPPLFGITPALLSTVTPIEGIKIGAGIACNHCIPIKPSSESPHIEENQVIISSSYDSASQTYSVVRDSNSYYTFQGVKVMASASFDPKAFVPMPFLGAEDLKLYGEIALLGVKNYGYLYEDRLERMPVMVGINLPTFKLLDILSVEVEHYNSKFVNDITKLVYSQSPIWNVPDDGSLDSQEDYNLTQGEINRDNWKWSVYGKKTITKGIEIYGQAASDHLRTINLNGGPLPTMVPVTNRNGKDWYYLIRLQFGI